MNQEKLSTLINQTKNLSVLYVEDNEEVRNQTLKMLDIFFKYIDFAVNGQEGFKMFNEKDYDILITDIKMPEIDGMKLIELIRKVNSNISILVLSAHDDRDFLIRSIEFNVEGYILKPYNINQITETICKVMNRNDSLKNKNTILLIDDFSWDINKKQLMKSNEIIKLTNNEINLFNLFCSTTKPSLSYSEIEEGIFEDYSFDYRRIRNLLSRLRKKTGIDLFNSIYGYGYEIRTLNDDS